MSSLAKSQKFWPLIFLAGTLIAIILLAGGLSELPLRPGEPFPFSLLWGGSAAGGGGGAGLRPDVPASLVELAMMLTLFLLTLVLLLWIITFIIRPQARKRMLRRIITYLALLLLVYSMLNLFEQMELNPLVEAEAGQGQGQPAAPLEPLPEPPAFVIEHPQWLVLTVAFGVIALLLGGLWWLMQRRPSQQSTGAEQERLDQFLRETQQALDHLQRGGQWHQTVLDCYQAMSRLFAEERGIERGQAMTVRDFERHLAGLGLRDEHIRRLTRLFEQVRYGSATGPNPAAEAEALDCLSAIAKSYGRTA